MFLPHHSNAESDENSINIRVDLPVKRKVKQNAGFGCSGSNSVEGENLSRPYSSSLECS